MILQQALSRQNLTLQPGDAILVNTGWGRLWEKDNARYLGPSPGIGVAATEWLAKQDPLLIGGDTGPVEVMPNPDPRAESARASDAAGAARYSLVGEPETGRSVCEACLRICLRHAAAEDQGRNRLDGCAGRGTLAGVLDVRARLTRR